MGPLIQSLIGKGADTILGLGVGWYNDKRQLNQQGKLLDQQQYYDQQQKRFEQELQYDMWQKTNYKAQVEELKKAGLNPGLIYGMSGGGGATTGNTSGTVHSANAPQGGGELTQALGLQTGLIAAQIENIKADTNKKNVEATKTQGVDTAEAQTRIQKLIQDTKEGVERTALTSIQKEIAALEQRVKGETVEDQIHAIEWTASKVFRELQILDDAQYVSHATRLTRVEAARQDLANAVIQHALTTSQVSKTKAEIAQIAQEIVASIATVDQNERRLMIETKVKELQMQFPGLGQATGRILNDAIESIFKIIKTERTKHY